MVDLKRERGQKKMINSKSTLRCECLDVMASLTMLENRNKCDARVCKCVLPALWDWLAYARGIVRQASYIGERALGSICCDDIE